VALAAGASPPGGNCRPVSNLAARDAQRTDKRDPVRIVVGFAGNMVHQGSDRVVDEQEAVEFLVCPVGALGSQYET
jgi:hypothetical protein